MVALDAAGFHVVAPDMRGYGSTDAPQPGRPEIIWCDVYDVLYALVWCWPATLPYLQWRVTVSKQYFRIF
jgi:pimeloyl-ACP methyl ester carboxylesterase